MRDGPIRRILKRLARGRYWIDVRCTRVLLRLCGEPRYELQGSCKGCGQCCEHPSIRVHPATFYLPSLRRLCLGWHRLVNGFELEEEHPKASGFTFHCTHLDPDTRRCDAYGSRPGLCRDYPRNQLYSPTPQLFPGCGFRIVLRNADRFRRALDRTDLTVEQREALEEQLHLRSEDDATPT
jgi:Fe-S-cluster containining protein